MTLSQNEVSKVEINEVLSDIPSTLVTTAVLSDITNEDGFMKISVDLGAEAGALIGIASSILPNDKKVWDRDESIVVGNMIRLAKLVSGFLDQICQRRLETAHVFSRLIFESIVNTRFLIKNATPELFESYIRHSLRHERKLHDLIHKNIKNRGGQELPIERRMLNSIKKTCDLSQINIEAISLDEHNKWGGKSLYDRASDVGLSSAYLGPYGGGSNSIHGNWMDLLDYHLIHESGGFSPRLIWTLPRPQVLLSITLLSLQTANKYLEYNNCPAETPIIQRIKKLCDLVTMTDRAHEAFLVKHSQI